MADRCRSCKAPVRWAITATGRLMPLNLEPDDNGEWAIAKADRAGTPRVIYVPPARREDYAGSLYVPHWATCPYAEQHREK